MAAGGRLERHRARLAGCPPASRDVRPRDAHTIAANGYEYTVEFFADANGGPARVARGGALSLESLDIDSSVLDVAGDGYTLTLHVVAAPATWTHGFANKLSVLSLTDLSSTNSISFTNSTLSSDGTVTFILPLDFATSDTTFFCVQY